MWSGAILVLIMKVKSQPIMLRTKNYICAKMGWSGLEEECATPSLAH